MVNGRNDELFRLRKIEGNYIAGSIGNKVVYYRNVIRVDHVEALPVNARKCP